MMMMDMSASGSGRLSQITHFRWIEMSRLTPLNSLLKATEKQVVVKIINLVFVEISNPSTSSHEGCAPEVQQLLELESIEEATQVK